MNFKIIILFLFLLSSIEANNKIDYCKGFTFKEDNKIVSNLWKNPWNKKEVKAFLKKEFKELDEWLLFRHIVIWNNDKEIINLAKKHINRIEHSRKIEKEFNIKTSAENKLFYNKFKIDYKYISNTKDPYHYILTKEEIKSSFPFLCSKKNQIESKIKRPDLNFIGTLIFEASFNKNKDAERMLKHIGFSDLLYMLDYNIMINKDIDYKKFKKESEIFLYKVNLKLKALESLMMTRDELKSKEKIVLHNKISLYILKGISKHDPEYIDMLLKIWSLSNDSIILNKKLFISHEELILSKKIMKKVSNILVNHYISIRNSNLAESIDLETTKIILEFVDSSKFK